MGGILVVVVYILSTTTIVGLPTPGPGPEDPWVGGSDPPMGLEDFSEFSFSPTGRKGDAGGSSLSCFSPSLLSSLRPSTSNGENRRVRRSNTSSSSFKRADF